MFPLRTASSEKQKITRCFSQTELLAPGDCETFVTVISNDGFASYDDSGKAGHKSCYILESGIYDFYVGNSVRNCEKVYSFTLESTVVTAELSEVMAVSETRVVTLCRCLRRRQNRSVKGKVPVRTVSLKIEYSLLCLTEKKSAVTKAISSPM